MLNLALQTDASRGAHLNVIMSSPGTGMRARAHEHLKRKKKKKTKTKRKLTKINVGIVVTKRITSA